MSKKNKRNNQNNPNYQQGNNMINDENQAAESTAPTVVDQGTEVKTEAPAADPAQSESLTEEGGSEDLGGSGDSLETGDPEVLEVKSELPATADVTSTEVTEVKEPAPVVNVEVKTAAPEVKETLEVKPVEVKAPAVEVKEEVKQTVSTTVKTEAPVEAASNLSILKAKIAESGSDAAKKLVATLESYIGAMRPGLPVTAEKGNQQQQALWFAIRNTVENSKPEDFRQLWFIILSYFHHHKNGALGPRHLFRFAESWNRSLEDLKGFQKILNIIRLTADPEERESGLKQVDIASNLQDGFTEEGRSRVVQYYKG